MTTSPLLGTVDRAAGAVHLERTLPAPVHQVWDALTDPTRLHAWLAPVRQGRPGPGGTFVLQMNDRETATCTVTTWDPPHQLVMVWDYTGEGRSQLSLRLSELDGRTRIALAHTRIPADPVQYGAGWHVHLDSLAAHLTGAERTAGGCDEEDFLAAYHTLAPRYAAAAAD
jgi:uncharacterized protein YndB with AHSA1/START domain